MARRSEQDVYKRQVIKHYIDRAFSAKTDNRPDFQQMIKDSEKRLFDIVLVWKLDRFARNRYDSAHYEYQLERNHVKLVSATEPISDGPAAVSYTHLAPCGHRAGRCYVLHQSTPKCELWCFLLPA